MFLRVTSVLRVLLVDTRADQRQMYAETLQRHGFSTLQAATARDAYFLASELPPDIVVTEMSLGGDQTGLDLTRRLKRETATRHARVVMLTARQCDGDEAAATDAGCDAFLTKPCLPDALVICVHRLLP
jgi:DNA-binding response OmpR family regulator